MSATTARCRGPPSSATYGNCAVTDAHDPLPLRLAMQGLPLPGMTIRAVDPAPLHGGPAFETEENMARVFAFLSAALAPSGKAALDKAS
jgi:hypothetical protein